ncbi:hypothetical protein [Bacillus weihaiensis]|uniref:hypothetical protein n=1 Tax=Bacillus weihaiensis TaxID=1547283 RepID=UPI00235618A4|nr:hypothetical protein [Bacillus weihaiensis]
MKRIITISILFILLLIILNVFRVHVNPASTIPGNIETIEMYNTSFGKAILYEDKSTGTFGIAEVNKVLGFIFYYNEGINSYYIEDGKPFVAAGYGDTNKEFMVGVKVPKGTNIKYIALGNDPDRKSTEITLEIAKQNKGIYQLKEVKGEYAVFKTDGYSENSWTIRGYDKNGKLVADKLFGEEAKFVD